MTGFEAETFSGAVVKAMHCQFNVRRRDGLEAHFLWKELADEPVHVLVGTAFPRGIGVGKEEVSIEFLGDSLMLGEFLPIVCRQRMNTGCKGRQQRDHRI